MRFKFLLDIHEIEGLPPRECSKNSKFVVGIQWAGSGRKFGLLPGGGGFNKDQTSKQAPQANGNISWNQRFSRTCKLQRITGRSYKSWAIKMQIREVDGDVKGKARTIGETGIIDIAEYAPEATKGNITLRMPVKCNIRDEHVDAVAVLKTSIQLVELRSKGLASLLPRALSLRSLSCVGLARNFGSWETVNPSSGHGTVYPSAADSWTSEDVSQVTYRELSVANVLLSCDCEEEDSHYYGQLDKESYLPEEELYDAEKKRSPEQQPPSLVRLLSSRAKLGFKATNHHLKGQPLLNKDDSNEIGGDDIDSERLHQSGGRTRPPVLADDTNEGSEQRQIRSTTLGFEDEGHFEFEVGVWKKKRILSRDGDMELVTGAFLASLDQHSDKAAGGSACTVLAVVIADWLHRNPQSLPLRCQLDELVREGCSEWRKLCADENHRKKFSDHHFDLDTVLKAKVRPLTEDKGMSYVGFFSIDGAHFLQDTMSFDAMWDELVSNAAAAAAAAAHGERVYIASWNDHFFVLKMVRDAIYLIDTFGERLYEGCKQAYILRFDDESVIYRRRGSRVLPAGSGVGEEEEEVVEVVCRGIVSCKVYIKGFLAALPLRELQHDAERELLRESNLRRLQIELHCTVSC